MCLLILIIECVCFYTIQSLKDKIYVEIRNVQISVFKLVFIDTWNSVYILDDDFYLL